jgi:hypothetical protein
MGEQYLYGYVKWESNIYMDMERAMCGADMNPIRNLRFHLTEDTLRIITSLTQLRSYRNIMHVHCVN